MLQNTYESFYKLPRFLYKEERYTYIHSKAKLLLSICYDDKKLVQFYQQQNPDTQYFFDDTHQTYIAPTREELAQLLNCHQDTVTRLKRELIDAGLLRQEHAGNGKPPRLYPLAPQNVSKGAKGFFKVPKSLFTDDFYCNMSCEAKILYSILESRYQLSKANDFKDRTGKVCCKFSYSELTKLMKCSSKTIKKLKDELLALGLILQVPDEISQSLIYYITKPRNRNNKVQQQEKEVKHKTTSTQGERQKESAGSANGKWSGSANGKRNYTTNIYTKYNYNNSDKYDKYIDNISKKEQHTQNIRHNRIDLELYQQHNAEKERYLSQFPDLIALALKPYAMKDIENYMSIICHTKNAMNEWYNTDHTLEDMEIEISRVIDKVKRKMKKNKETPADMYGYFKVAIMNCVIDYDINLTLELLASDGFTMQQLNQSKRNMELRKEERMQVIKQHIFETKSYSA
ncbi:replication initiator protein A [Staphylococcus pettenkoferi]|uniref:replication initiator protein A n=1 Tax=Staphylococcus pettenkoferi TaxID=170573 RepID=UPI00255400E3|nr:replication initiator protein A [Staphylococcus pettenkoferi]MDK7284330.1 replication initiator protein A [Staphylococcus pettenkoferi]